MEGGGRMVSGELWEGWVLLLLHDESSLREPPPAVPGSRGLLPLSAPPATWRTACFLSPAFLLPSPLLYPRVSRLLRPTLQGFPLLHATIP